jgi:hypothetical protein
MTSGARSACADRDYTPLREIRLGEVQSSGAGSRGRRLRIGCAYLDFVIRPTKPGPDSEPSSWRTRFTGSPLQVSTTLLSSAFQLQASVSPMIVKLAFPPSAVPAPRYRRMCCKCLRGRRRCRRRLRKSRMQRVPQSVPNEIAIFASRCASLCHVRVNTVPQYIAALARRELPGRAPQAARANASKRGGPAAVPELPALLDCRIGWRCCGGGRRLLCGRRRSRCFFCWCCRRCWLRCRLGVWSDRIYHCWFGSRIRGRRGGWFRSRR